jgi:hypothetical protein
MVSKLFSDQLTYKPVTPAEWPDFVHLFEEYGPQNGCWCMYWRIRRSECQHQYGEDNKLAFSQIVEAGPVPGILVYHQGQSIGGCSIAPPEAFGGLDRSLMLKRVDDLPVWSSVCFFVSKPYRRWGLTGLFNPGSHHLRQGRQGEKH